MTAHAKAATEPESRTQSPEPAGADRERRPAPTGLALVAKRISVWTTRGIVSGIILVASLAFGRQVLYWWSEEGDQDAGQARLQAVGGLGDLNQEHFLQFGESPWCMSRRPVAGSEKHLLGVLRARCAELTTSSPLPEGPPAPAEERLLQRLSSQSPVQEQLGQWRLYELQAAFPMVVGVRPIAALTSTQPSERVANPGYRVVTWAIAVPAGPNAWTAYTFYAAHPGTGGNAGPSDLPVPPGTRRTLLIQAADGGAVASFRGPNHPDAWRRFYNAWLEGHGWKVLGGWYERGSSWSIRCSSPTEPASLLDVQLAADSSGEMTGLVLLTPPFAQR